VHHLVDVLGGLAQLLRALQPQGVAIVQKRLRVDGGELLDRLLLRHRVADNFIVHIRDVHDVLQSEAVQPEDLAKEVHERERAEVADVREIVNRGAAGIHADRVIACRSELLDLLGKRIVEAQGHGWEREVLS
jgi:hypothetical protein